MQSNAIRRWILLAGLLATWPSLAGASDPDGDDALWLPATLEGEPEPSPAAAEMLKSMREKGLLSEDEYEELYRRQTKFEIEQRTRDDLPGWARDWTFGGDFRLRFERRNFASDNTLAIDPTNATQFRSQNRARYRLRVGAEKRVLDWMTVGFRVATSSGSEFGTFFNRPTTLFGTRFESDLRSAQSTMGDFFALDDLFVDRAYLRLDPTFAPTLSVTGGKMANPFRSRHHRADILVWDPDIQPEGLAIEYRFDFQPEQLWVETAAAGFLVEEVGRLTGTFSVADGNFTPREPVPDDADSFMYGLQAGLFGRPLPWVQAGVRTSYYELQRIGMKLSAALRDLGNGGDAIDDDPLFSVFDPSQSNRSRGKMQQVVVDGFLEFTPWDDRYRIAPFFLYSTMLSADTEDEAYGIGVELGSADFLKLSMMWARVERNGTIALFTDSNLFEGFTNAQGWYVTAERELFRGVRMRAAWMRSEQNNEDCKAGTNALCDSATLISALGAFRRTTLDRDRWQIDLMVDF